MLAEPFSCYLRISVVLWLVFKRRATRRFVVAVDVTGELTCSWCNLGIWRRSMGVTTPLCVSSLTWAHLISPHTRRHSRHTRTEYALWRPTLFFTWKCIIRRESRNVACGFISVWAWSFYFCLWMLSRCSPPPQPLQCFVESAHPLSVLSPRFSASSSSLDGVQL